MFRIILADDTTYASSALKVVGNVPLELLASQAGEPRLAAHFAGRGFEVTMMSEDGRLQVVWCARAAGRGELHSAGVELDAPKDPLAVREITWLDATIPSAVSAGVSMDRWSSSGRSSWVVKTRWPRTASWRRRRQLTPRTVWRNVDLHVMPN